MLGEFLCEFGRHKMFVETKTEGRVRRMVGFKCQRPGCNHRETIAEGLRKRKC